MSIILKKIIGITFCVIFGLLAVYLGIFCVTTLMKALSQPYLQSMNTTHHFLGYYIMSGIFGVLTLLSAALAVICGVLAGKKRKKTAE